MGFLILAGNFLRSPIGKYLLIAVACLGVLLTANRCGHASGVREEMARDQKAQEAARAAIRASEARATAISAEAATELASARAAITVRTETITKRIPVYVTRQADARCTVPTGFVRLFNDAAEGREASVPAAPGRSLDAPSGLALSDVARATADNFGIAYNWQAEALAWRRWYADQKAAWDRR